MFSSDDYILIALVIAFVSFALNLVIIFGYNSIFKQHKIVMRDLLIRVSYMEVVLHHYGLVPLPWEIEGFKKYENSKKATEAPRVDNIVYLKRGDHKK